MDAKILRAAVSAAIRVTVSTTVIGCGGQSTTDIAGGVAATGGITATSDGGSARPSQQAKPAYPKSEPTTGGKAGAEAGKASGGAFSGGSAASGGVGIGGTVEGGETSGGEANGGAPTATCDASLDACLSVLEAIDRVAPLTPAATACCKTVMEGLLSEAPDGSAVCDATRSRFNASPAFWPCCETGVSSSQPDGWMRTGCTPWGPPVPPELTLQALSELENAA